MRDLLIVWKHLRTPVFLYPHFDDVPLAWAPPDVLHDHVIPCPAHLSASVEAIQAVQDNCHHNLCKDEVMTWHEPLLIVFWGHFTLIDLKNRSSLLTTYWLVEDLRQKDEVWVRLTNLNAMNIKWHRSLGFLWGCTILTLRDFVFCVIFSKDSCICKFILCFLEVNRRRKDTTILFPDKLYTDFLYI